jgi:dihydrofolate reductase
LIGDDETLAAGSRRAKHFDDLETVTFVIGIPIASQRLVDSSYNPAQRTLMICMQASMSLDGFIAGPGNSGFDMIFAWTQNGDTVIQSANTGRLTYRTTAASAQAIREMLDETGALVVGRNLFDMTNGWDGTHPMGVPVFVVTHNVPEDFEAKGTPYTFVTDGVDAALDAALEVAGDKTVGVGPGDVAWQALDAGRVDLIKIDLVPIVLGGGNRMFDRLSNAPTIWSNPRVVEGDRVTHLVYERLNGATS